MKETFIVNLEEDSLVNICLQCRFGRSIYCFRPYFPYTCIYIATINHLCRIVIHSWNVTKHFCTKELTSKPVGFMQSCSRWLPLAWVAEFHAVLHLASHARHPHMDVIRTQMSSTCRCCLHIHTVCMRMSSACCLHLHVIRTHTCHLHIICSTPHGQHGPKLSFYSDRIWLLNGICHKSVELFHFRIT